MVKSPLSQPQFSIHKQQQQLLLILLLQLYCKWTPDARQLNIILPSMLDIFIVVVVRYNNATWPATNTELCSLAKRNYAPGVTPNWCILLLLLTCHWQVAVAVVVVVVVGYSLLYCYMDFAGHYRGKFLSSTCQRAGQNLRNR